MAEQGEVDKYVKCSKCRCKYINDDDHIKNDFGYNRLNERYKTCVTCREKHRKWCNDNKEHKKDYAKQFYSDANNREHIKEYYRTHRGYIREKLICANCNSTVSRDGMLKHTRSDKCMAMTKSTSE